MAVVAELKEENDSEAVESTKTAPGWWDSKESHPTGRLSGSTEEREPADRAWEAFGVFALRPAWRQTHLCSLETLKPKLLLDVVKHWSTAEQTQNPL